MCRKKLQQEFLDHGVLTLLKNWLEPLPDGSLPNMNIRSAILKLLTDVSITLLCFMWCFSSNTRCCYNDKYVGFQTDIIVVKICVVAAYLAICFHCVWTFITSESSDVNGAPGVCLGTQSMWHWCNISKNPSLVSFTRCHIGVHLDVEMVLGCHLWIWWGWWWWWFIWPWWLWICIFFFIFENCILL